MSYCGAIASRLLRCGFPCLAAIEGISGHVVRAERFLVVASHGDDFIVGTKTKGEDASRWFSACDGRFHDGPSQPEIEGMKVSGSAGSARPEGSLLRAADQTGVTGGKSALA